MSIEVAGIIERWFLDHSEDEFARIDRDYPYQVIGPTRNAKRIVYATKAHIIFKALEGSSAPEELGIIAQYGLPSKNDADWLADIIGARELIFLGDMDPVDLMIFAWLRAFLTSIPVTHFGINDNFLSKLECQIREHYRLRLGPSEQAAVPLLEEELLDLRETVGPECFSLLKQGYKIELEAVVSVLGTAVPILSLAARFHSS